MAKATLNGIEMHYESVGSGPAVLLSHGYSATGRMWQRQQSALGQSHHVIAWDMRGHGETESPEDPGQYSASLTVGDMASLLDHLGVDRAVVGGLSLGGYMSLAFYHAHPERVRALVICDSGPGYRNPDSRDAWNTRAGQRAAELEEKGLETLAAWNSEMRDAARYHRSAQGLAHAARGMLAQVDSTVIDSLPRIDVPTLIIVGDRDEPFIAPSNYMARKIPGARLEVIKDAGHASNLDQPDAFNDVLRDFLGSLA